jgi:hypothetical protein
LTTRSNTVKTVDLRIDVHQDSKEPNKTVAKVQANTQAKDNAVKDYIKSGNKGSGKPDCQGPISETFATLLLSVFWTDYLLQIQKYESCNGPSVLAMGIYFRLSHWYSRHHFRPLLLPQYVQLKQ